MPGVHASPSSRAGSREQSRLAGLGALLASAACVLTAQRILLVAVPWLVLTETGSAAATGLVSAAQVTPVLLAKVFGGPLLDRVGGARFAVAGDLLCGVQTTYRPLPLTSPPTTAASPRTQPASRPALFRERTP
jgi:hypothetical protein